MAEKSAALSWFEVVAAGDAKAGSFAPTSIASASLAALSGRNLLRFINPQAEQCHTVKMSSVSHALGTGRHQNL